MGAIVSFVTFILIRKLRCWIFKIRNFNIAIQITFCKLKASSLFVNTLLKESNLKKMYVKKNDGKKCLRTLQIDFSSFQAKFWLPLTTTKLHSDNPVDYGLKLKGGLLLKRANPTLNTNSFHQH